VPNADIGLRAITVLVAIGAIAFGVLLYRAKPVNLDNSKGE